MTEHEQPALTEVAIVVLVCDGRALVRARPAPDPELAGLLEFPGGHVQPDESPAAAAARELHEETGLRAASLDLLESVVHAYSDRRLRLHFFRGELAGSRPSTPPMAPTPEVATEWQSWQWRALKDLLEAPVPAANRAVIRRLLRPDPGRPPAGCPQPPTRARRPSRL